MVMDADLSAPQVDPPLADLLHVRQHGGGVKGLDQHPTVETGTLNYKPSDDDGGGTKTNVTVLVGLILLNNQMFARLHKHNRIITR